MASQTPWADGDHRPLTLVFARDRTEAAVREALFDRRTAVYSGTQLIGKEAFLRPIYDRSVRLLNPKLTLVGKQRVLLQVQNDSDVRLELEAADELVDLDFTRKVALPGGKTALVELRARTADLEGERAIKLPYRVKNLLIGPEQSLTVELPLTVRFNPR